MLVLVTLLGASPMAGKYVHMGCVRVHILLAEAGEAPCSGQYLVSLIKVGHFHSFGSPLTLFFCVSR